MQKSRTKPDHEAFLGTAEIVQRVRRAQNGGLGHIVARAARLGGWVLCLSGIAGLAGLSFYAARSVGPALFGEARSRGAPARKAPAAAQVPDESDAPAKTAGHSPERSIRGGHREGGHPSVRAQQVQVQIDGSAGTIWLDGSQVAHGERRWRGPLSVGQHQLAVRVGGHMLRHTFAVAGSSVTLVVNPGEQSIVVRGAHANHRVDRAP